jgi:hypothetical protein
MYKLQKHMPHIDMLPRPVGPGAARLPGWAERVGNGQIGRLERRKACSSPSAFHVGDPGIIIRAHSVHATTSLDRHVQTNFLSCATKTNVPID